MLSKSVAEPYAALIGASEADLSLVVIDGVARYGTPKFLEALKATFVAVEIAGRKRGVQYHDASANKDIDSLSLADAKATLKSFFGSLGSPKVELAKELAEGRPEPKVRLALNELDPNKAQRHQLPYRGEMTGWRDSPRVLAAVAPLPLENLDIDPLTVHDDVKFVPAIEGQTNLPSWMKAGLSKVHS